MAELGRRRPGLGVVHVLRNGILKIYHLLCPTCALPLDRELRQAGACRHRVIEYAMLYFQVVPARISALQGDRTELGAVRADEHAIDVDINLGVRVVDASGPIGGCHGQDFRGAGTD